MALIPITLCRNLSQVIQPLVTPLTFKCWTWPDWGKKALGHFTKYIQTLPVVFQCSTFSFACVIKRGFGYNLGTMTIHPSKCTAQRFCWFASLFTIFKVGQDPEFGADSTHSSCLKKLGSATFSGVKIIKTIDSGKWGWIDESVKMGIALGGRRAQWLEVHLQSRDKSSERRCWHRQEACIINNPGQGVSWGTLPPSWVFRAVLRSLCFCLKNQSVCCEMITSAPFT